MTTDQMARDHVANLTSALDAIESRFHINGAIKDRSISLTMGENVMTFPMSLEDAQSKLAALLTAAKPSPFGRGQETVIDPSVRVAKELLPETFTVDFDPNTSGILEQVRVCPI
jgi:hypothetical protein